MTKVADLFVVPCPIPFFEQARAFSEPFGIDLPNWWAAAPQGNWMLWVAATCGLSEARLIEAAAACARVGFRFNPEAPQRLEPAVQLAERGGRGDATPADCFQASDEVSEYQSQILDACSLPNTLAAAQAAGAVGQLTAAAAFRGNRADCVKLAVGCATQITAAGHYVKGENSQAALHARCAEVVRACVRAEELSLPES